MKPSLTSLQVAYKKLAALVLADPVYIPVFKRIQLEIEVLESNENMIERAKAVCALHKAVG